MLNIKESIFKAYDIRGVYPEDLNEDLVYKIGRAYITILQNENPGKELNIVVGQDHRISSPGLSKSLMRGIVDQGANVIDIGLVSTPTFYFGVSYYEYDGGMQVSASHNPKEYNGVKMVRARAVPVSGDTGIMDIKEMVIKNKFADPVKKGEVTKKGGVLEEQVRFALKYTDVKKIKPLKVVIDPANSMGAPLFEQLFKHLPCELIKMNFELDGTFPSHQPDPLVEENVIDIKNKVIEVGADIGIASDGDADRVFYIDDKGERVEPAIIRGLLAKIFLREKPGSKIAYDIRPGRITRDMILENGGVPIVTRVGHSLIKETCIKEGVYFAGESSGHMFLQMPHGFYEAPLITTLKILQEISAENKSFSEIIEPLKKYFHSGEINFKVEDKEGMMKKLEEKYTLGAKEVIKIDGISIEHGDWWFNVRASNTEPLLRLNLEAKTKELMEEKRDEISKIIYSEF